MSDILLMMIALWCGNPSYMRLTSGEINRCRQHMIKCIVDNGASKSALTKFAQGEPLP